MCTELMLLLQPQSQLISKALFRDRKQTRKATRSYKYRKVKITKATFCMYDVIMKRDVRVEISIPGGTHVFAMDDT